MNAEKPRRFLLLCLSALLSLPAAVSASLESPSLSLPENFKTAENWRGDIVLEAHSADARLRLTKMRGLKTAADHFSLNGADGDRLHKLGAKVEKRLRAFHTASGRRLLAIEATHRDKRLYTGYINGPENTYAFLASGLPLSAVAVAVETLRFPGEEISPERDSRAGAAGPADAFALPPAAEMKDALAPLPEEKTEPAVESGPSPWPGRFKALLGWTMLLIGFGFIWRLIFWAKNRRHNAVIPTAVPPVPPAPGSAAALTPLPPFKKKIKRMIEPLPL